MPYRRLLLFFLFALPVAAPAQLDPSSIPPPPKLTLPLMLRKLHTTARILHITAHPDDEDGGMLAYESWGKGADVMLLTLDRGEGGQNATGPELFDQLGLLRTLELLEADKYYGVEQRFTRLADFGFSKTAADSLRRWHGANVGLEDMVRVIREFQPDVIISRFQGLPRDGHGQHQVAGILAREAFRAAADPKMFPNQIKEGLMPWQAKKLYVGNVHPGEEWNVKIDTNQYDPELGDTFADVAMNGLHHQLSQGAGNWKLPPGPHYTRYKLVDTTIPDYKPGHEQDFTDGIDDSLAGLVSETKRTIPEIAPWIQRVANAIAQLPKKEIAASVNDLAGTINDVDYIESHPRSVEFQNVILKTSQLGFETRRATDIANRITSTAELSPLGPNGPRFLVRGEKLEVRSTLVNGGPQTIEPVSFSIMPFLGKGDYKKSGFRPLRPNQAANAILKLAVSNTAKVSRPQFWREDPERDSIVKTREGFLASLPLPPDAFAVQWTYGIDYKTGVSKTEIRNQPGKLLPGPPNSGIFIAPKFSLWLSPATQLTPISSHQPINISVQIASNLSHRSNGSLSLTLPFGWRASPASQKLTFIRAGETQTATFKAIPGTAAAEQVAKISANFSANGKTYAEGYKLIGRPDVGYYPFYRPATQRVSLVNVTFPKSLNVGYIMGAGDQIPEALRELGVSVQEISPQQLATGDLSRYSAIITGIRAYDLRADVRQYNSRLLQFVSNGGTLMVLYNSNVQQFNAGNFAPYPLTLSRDRVTDPDAAIHLLDPSDPSLHSPNFITQSDFDGWIQERGTYFASEWASRFHPIFACSDTGEQPLAGGLLVAHYGQGTYIYNGYSFFRQLPYGVPGAVRIFVNLLSAGQIAGAKP